MYKWFLLMVHCFALDPTSHANLDEIITQHISLDLQPDFEEQRLVQSSVTLKMKALKNEVK